LLLHWYYKEDKGLKIVAMMTIEVGKDILFAFDGKVQFFSQCNSIWGRQFHIIFLENIQLFKGTHHKKVTF